MGQHLTLLLPHNSEVSNSQLIIENVVLSILLEIKDYQ